MIAAISAGASLKPRRSAPDPPCPRAPWHRAQQRWKAAAALTSGLTLVRCVRQPHKLRTTVSTTTRHPFPIHCLRSSSFARSVRRMGPSLLAARLLFLLSGDRTEVGRSADREMFRMHCLPGRVAWPTLRIRAEENDGLLRQPAGVGTKGDGSGPWPPQIGGASRGARPLRTEEDYRCTEQIDGPALSCWLPQSRDPLLLRRRLRQRHPLRRRPRPRWYWSC